MVSIVGFTIDSIKKIAREAAPHLYRRYVEYHMASLPPKVCNVLSITRNPVTLNDTEFDLLQKRYKQWWPQYDFDAYSTGRRAYERALSFLKLAPLREPGKNVLDIGCGDGMTGTALSIYGHQVTLLDYEDWRDSRAQGQNFILADMGMPLTLSDSSYDFIFSFNTFEHIPDPALALNEMVRILRPGGYIWVDFNPLYRSPLGLHTFSFRMPYPQFLFSEDVIKSKLSELGLNDLGHDMEMTQPLNRWRPEQFRELWNRSDCKIVEYFENRDFSHLDIVMKYPEAFQGRGLCLDDLTVAGIFVVLQKR